VRHLQHWSILKLQVETQGAEKTVIRLGRGNHGAWGITVQQIECFALGKSQAFFVAKNLMECCLTQLYSSVFAALTHD